jgi:hypothetical protein
MVKKAGAILIFLAALAASMFGAAVSSNLQAGGVCSPGQHGNPHPGYKPGVCDNK